MNFFCDTIGAVDGIKVDIQERAKMAMKKVLGRVEVVELVVGILLTAISIIGIVRISSLETKTSLHLHFYTNTGCEGVYKMQLKANPKIGQIDGYIKQPVGIDHGCYKVLLLSSFPIKSASQGDNGSIPVNIEAAKANEPKAFGVWYSFKDTASGRFVIGDIDFPSHMRNSFLLNVGGFDMRDVTSWTMDVKKFVASAPQSDLTSLQFDVLGDYEVSAESRSNSCRDIEHPVGTRVGEECVFDGLELGMLKLQINPIDFSNTQNFWIVLIGLFASSGFGLFFDAIRRIATKSMQKSEGELQNI